MDHLVHAHTPCQFTFSCRAMWGLPSAQKGLYTATDSGGCCDVTRCPFSSWECSPQLSNLCEDCLHQKTTLTQGHTSFQGSPYPIADHHKDLMPSRAALRQLWTAIPPRGWLRPLLDCNTAQLLPLLNPFSFPSLSYMWTWGAHPNEINCLVISTLETASGNPTCSIDIRSKESSGILSLTYRLDPTRLSTKVWFDRKHVF